MTVVVEVEELVTPLRRDSDRVLEERRDDQEAADSREVAAAGQMSAGAFSSVTVRLSSKALQGHGGGGGWRAGNGMGGQRNIRLDGLADAVQEVLNLAGLLPDRVERGGLLDGRGRPELRPGAHAVASRTSRCHVGGKAKPGASEIPNDRRRRRTLDWGGVLFRCGLFGGRDRQTGWDREAGIIARTSVIFDWGEGGGRVGRPKGAPELCDVSRSERSSRRDTEEVNNKKSRERFRNAMKDGLRGGLDVGGQKKKEGFGSMGWLDPGVARGAN